MRSTVRVPSAPHNSNFLDKSRTLLVTPRHGSARNHLGGGSQGSKARPGQGVDAEVDPRAGTQGALDQQKTMSYLSSLRLHFAGRFETDINILNNSLANVRQAAEGTLSRFPSDGRGTGAWRLHQCRVTALWLADQRPGAPTDPANKLWLTDSSRRVSAKLVDLDPQQQSSPILHGLDLQLQESVEPVPRCFLRGRMVASHSVDLWVRRLRGADDMTSGGGAFQSILQGVVWDDELCARSLFLTELRKATAENSLSIKFNLDGFTWKPGTAEHCTGRIVGTIGPHRAGEPPHQIVGRQLLARDSGDFSTFRPAQRLNHGVILVDEACAAVRIDLGNSLPTVSRGGPFEDLGNLDLTCFTSTPDGSGRTEVPLGPIVSFPDSEWYGRTAGIATLALTPEQIPVVRAGQLSVKRRDPWGGIESPLVEAPLGLHVRAERHVFRLEPGQEERVRLIATRQGQREGRQTILLFLDPSWLNWDGRDKEWRVGIPESAIEFPRSVETDDQGVAIVTLKAKDPGSPRPFADGQVYAIRYALEKTLAPSLQYPFNKWDFLSVRVWSGFQPGEQNPTWWGSIHKILQPYALLYPMMREMLDLDDYADVCRHQKSLQRVLEILDPDDPHYMPVSRDLSPAKRRWLRQWLEHLTEGPHPGSAKARPREGVERQELPVELTRRSLAGMRNRNGNQVP